METSKEALDNVICSEKITKGKRTYFFDIKQCETGDLYLKILESKKTDTGFERNNILIFHEDLKDFALAFNKILFTFLEKSSSIQIEEKKSNSTKNVGLENKMMPWTKEDDDALEKLYCEKKSVKEIASLFKRSDGAINSRIKKLELIEKYGSF
jgi:hypothetical protein